MVNILREASESRASAPSPYTVSVGNTTHSFFSFRWWAAVRRATRVSGELMEGSSEPGGKCMEVGSHESTWVVNLDVEDEEPMVKNGLLDDQR